MKTLSMRKKAIYEQEAIPFEEYNIVAEKLEEKLQSYKQNNGSYYLVPISLILGELEPFFKEDSNTIRVDRLFKLCSYNMRKAATELAKYNKEVLQTIFLVKEDNYTFVKFTTARTLYKVKSVNEKHAVEAVISKVGYAITVEKSGVQKYYDWLWLWNS